ncbi:hypothetical protein ACIBO2_26235 [Nonomuraea sp. NPDC050022]|uniref:hypothetical protein n=1 Tax=Nonomuraea sp. NPDC050022 TaxID=3364358 RepID=UPI0037B9E8FD
MNQLITNRNYGCSVWWCNNLHDLPDDPHFGNGSEFNVLLDAFLVGREIEGTIDVSLDQIQHGGEVMVSICSTMGALWMTRTEAKRLALRILQMDLEADDAGAAS